MLLLTDCPEVYSHDPEDPQDRSFAGYSFRFPAVSELAGLTDDPALGERIAAVVLGADQVALLRRTR